MTDLTTPELAAAGAAITLAYAVFGFGGFGAGLVALPLLAHLMTLRVAVPVLLVMDLCSATLMGLKNRPLVDTGEIKRLVPTLLAGMAVGVLMLQHTADRWLLLLLGAFVTGFALWSLFGRSSAQPVSPRWAWPAGLAGGVFSALFGTGGPVYTLYLARRLHDTSRLRATIGALILGSALLRLMLLTGSGLLLQGGVLRLALTLVPCAVAGYFIGSQLNARLPQAQVRRFIWAMLLASGASLLARALAMA